MGESAQVCGGIECGFMSVPAFLGGLTVVLASQRQGNIRNGDVRG